MNGVRRRASAYADTLSTSFLDVLSNGLGAGILLMVLIAAVPVAVPATLSPDAPYIRASWTVTGDPAAILSLRLTPPGGGSYDLDLRGASGPVYSLESCKWPGVKAGGRLDVFGFTVTGQAAATLKQDIPIPDRKVVLWINEPVSGVWVLTVTYANRADSLRQSPGNQEINVTSSVEGSNSTNIGPKEAKLLFGGSESISFEFGGSRSEEATDERPDCKWAK